LPQLNSRPHRLPSNRYSDPFAFIGLASRQFLFMPYLSARVFVHFLLISGLAATAQSQTDGPMPIALPAPIDAPRDIAYPGKIELVVDLTDIQRRAIHVHEVVPVSPGPLTLLYPKWIPGNHSPTGPISKVAGLRFSTKGSELSWTRDPVDVFAFHVMVPNGVHALTADFDYLAPLRMREGRISISSNIADLAWNTVLLYPAGYFSRRITFEPTLKLPEKWHFSTALETRSQEGALIHFADTTLNTLVDSPLYAGVNFKRVDLSTAPTNQVFLDVFSDTPGDLALTPQQIDQHKKMVKEAASLFASHHYSHYDFLFLLSDTVGGIGLEHHQSSEDGTMASYFTNWDAGVANRDLLAHEYTHSWNGKFRRPAGLWTPNFDVPMQDDLLWVYEGLTQYWGYVLTARSGLRTPEQTRDMIARIAANFDSSPGRNWRTLVDTTNQPTISQRTPVSWVSWQRPEDYYMEGLLIWLDADTKIRELSKGKKSLDDFAKLFFGMNDGSYVTSTYTLGDVVTAMNAVQPFDWRAFLQDRVYKVSPQTPKDGITRGGYRLGYSDVAPDWSKKEGRDAMDNFSTSLGFSAHKNGELVNVWWDSPAYRAGVTPDMQITAVNGTTYSTEVLQSAIRDAEKSTTPIKLLCKRGKEFSTFELDYHGGLRYPKLERVEGTPDRLTDILSPTT
jgi:predicted metalloprotease with PDZ domain